MAAYPTLTTLDTSQRLPRSGTQVETADDGTVRARTLYSAIVYEFALTHYLTSAQKSSLESHYGTDKNATFSYTWPDGSVAHTVVYADAPRFQWMPSGWVAEVRLIGRVT